MLRQSYDELETTSKVVNQKLDHYIICNRRLNSDDLQFYQYQPKYSHRSPQITELNKDHDIWRWHFKYWSGTKWKKWQSYLKLSYIDNWTLQCQYSYHKKKYTDSLPLKKTKMFFFSEFDHKLMKTNSNERRTMWSNWNSNNLTKHFYT